MDDRHRLIEQQAREIQLAIYRDRDLLWPIAVPPLAEMFQPEKAAQVLGIGYELHPNLPLLNNGEVAGIIDRQANKIAVAQRFGFETQRFSGAHEVGHWLLHTSLVMHRDPPVRGISTERRPRPPQEEEADFFAACLLVPRKLLRQEFKRRFGVERLALDDVTAAHFGEMDAEAFFTKTTLERALLIAVARGRGRYESLARHFRVSTSTMAYRLLELDLIE